MEYFVFKAFLSFLFIGLCTPILIQGSSSQSPHLPVEKRGQNLGFNNYTGDSTSQGQVISFVNFINSASTYYRDDTQARLQYISDKMNRTYGTKQYCFSVIQTNNDPIFDWAVYTTTAVLASVAPGVDRIFPQNSYMFLKDYQNDDRVDINKVGQKGSGVIPGIQREIKNLILSAQTSSNCQCLPKNTLWIRDRLYQFDNQTWNVFCLASDNFSVAVYPKDAKYIYVRPKNCYYLLYVS